MGDFEQELLDSLPIGVWMKDCNGHYTYANLAFCNFTGRSADELIGSTDRELWNEAVADRLLADEERLIFLKIPVHKQDFVPVKGRMAWLEYRLTPVLDSDGNVVAIAGVGEDISLRKEVERQLASALDTALEARHMASLGIMAAGITHELNQPLQAIKLSADSIIYWFQRKKKFDPQAIMKALGLISRNAERINRIIARVRNFVKSRQANQPATAVDLNQAIRNSVEMMEHQLRSHGIELIFELDPTLAKIAGDETQTEEVVINLLTNSRQSLDLCSEPGKKIKIATMDMALGAGVCLLISDNGQGFSEEARANMFRPFFTTKAEGLGLGLSIVYSIVSGFSGKINLLPPTAEYTTHMAITFLKWRE